MIEVYLNVCTVLEISLWFSNCFCLDSECRFPRERVSAFSDKFLVMDFLDYSYARDKGFSLVKCKVITSGVICATCAADY